MRNLFIILSLVFLPLIVLCQQTQDSVNRQNSPDTTNTSSGEEVPEFLKSLVQQLEQQEEETSTEDVEIEIDGIIVNETRTKAGRDFYDQFFTAWEAPPGASNYSLKIRELPFRMSMTIIVVEVNDNEVFRSYLQPRQNIIEELAQQAVYNTTSYLANYEEIQKQLGSEDQMGSGIY